MNFLLDTQCWLWCFVSPERLNQKTVDLLVDRRNKLYLSTASVWEISIKTALGKLSLPEVPEKYIPSRMNQLGMKALCINNFHAFLAAQLPMYHRDPFDRMLIAQSKIEKIPIITADSVFSQYDVKIIGCAN